MLVRHHTVYNTQRVGELRELFLSKDRSGTFWIRNLIKGSIRQWHHLYSPWGAATFRPFINTSLTQLSISTSSDKYIHVTQTDLPFPSFSPHLSTWPGSAMRLLRLFVFGRNSHNHQTATSTELDHHTAHSAHDCWCLEEWHCALYTANYKAA